ncbi:class I SAM-dependent methyltransferase [uncultured Ramlibacter sp.]|uniref:class I SAM-dependent methyltransferase n=1 Tax=uncultured Ramlibacter sp. TaxID=260755 RepID=UPI002623E2CD|nr:class I SAM-dependent methyltransferase [uncultured Ramlibacter sp.]
MSEQWSEGYFTDVAYTYGYYRELSPVFQRFCLVVNGIAPPDTEQPAYCELGFGQGVSINIHAAAGSGKFVGNDFNPEHAAYAAGLASKAGSGALLTDDSFEQMLGRTDLPQFDYIGLHGIWSWVSKENQKFIVEFAQRKLKPGGVLYVSYNCFPGWAPYIPLRQAFALHDRHTDRSKPAADRVNAALEFTEKMFAAKPRYIQTAAGVQDRLVKLKEQSRNYLAHEYFNREWNTMYFTDVVDAMVPAKLNYAASCNPVDFVDAVNLTAEQVDFLKTIDNPVFREQIRDYMVNQQFRKDLYVRGARKLKRGERTDLLLDMRFALVVPVESVAYKVKMSMGEVQLREDIYKPVVEALATGNHQPKTLRQIVTALAATTISLDAIVQAVVVLAGNGWVSPCQSEAAAKAAKPACDKLNAEIAEQNLYSAEVAVWASPVTGGAVTVQRFSQLFMLARWRKHTDPALFAAEVLRANGEMVLKDGKALQTAEENLAHLREQYESFVAKHLPALKSLGVA